MTAAVASIAAAALVVLGAILWFSSQIEVNNTTRAVVEVGLPDGSQVALRPQSRLEYNTLRWLYSRDVELNGQGFFEVQKSEKTFSVQTDLGEVEVLGTSFSVSTDADALEVACKTGKVAVYVQSSSPVVLAAGEGLLAKDERTALYTRSPDEIDGWVRGQYSYENASVERVWRDLEAAFGLEVVGPDVQSLSYTGAFDADDPLEEVLEIICRPLELEYSIDKTNNVVRIKTRSDDIR